MDIDQNLLIQIEPRQLRALQDFVIPGVGHLCFCARTLVRCNEGTAQVKTQFEPRVGQEGKDVVWVPTQQELVEKMLDMAKVTPQDHVIDLGSGDGRTVITAAKRGARAVGIEYDPNMVELSKSNATKENVGNRATFLKADLFEKRFFAGHRHHDVSAGKYQPEASSQAP
jgi:methylase of polypeptide subunit release factors